MTEIDDKDRQILHELLGNARLTNVDLAERVALSPSACLRRVQALERSGAIEGYHARLSPTARGAGFVAYLAVGLNNHSKASQEAFERAMATASEVRECHNITGAVEYLLRIEVADLSAYKSFHTDIVGTLPQVASLTSYVVMGSPKDDRA
ncbi:MAG: Lrp/AsnC family transcriptional regulator [Pseudomonadota bacterium]